MSVMATRLPEIQAAPPPMAMASSRKKYLKKPISPSWGWPKVTSVATTMPMPAHRMPLLAVLGEDMRLRPTMNNTAVAK